MFNWVAKVVPQPNEPLGILGQDNPSNTAVKRGASKEDKTKAAKYSGGEIDSESSVQSGVLTWLSNGFVNALPQPAGISASPDAKSILSEEENRAGVIEWISQGLGKVIPQPDDKYKERRDPDECTEVYDLKEYPDFEPLPHIPVVEMVSDEEHSEVDTPFPPKVMAWIKQGFEKALPQPTAPGYTEPVVKRTSLTEKVLSPPPESSGAEEDFKSPNVMGWIVQGLGRLIPQPVLQPKDNPGDGTEDVQRGGKEMRAP